MTELNEARLEGHTLLGLYQVEEKVGRGGAAWVYKGQHIRFRAPVAIKVLHGTYAHESVMKQRFLREAQIQFHLRHPNIVQVREVIDEQGLTGFVMDWCEGGDLRDWLRTKRPPLSLENLAQILPPVLKAIHFAHQQGIIHRDLKPHNILMVRTPRGIIPKVTDFGIAKMLYEQSITKTGSSMGTLRYTAPEQIEDSKHIDHRADLFSLGVILYLLATGRLPFPGKYPAICTQILTQQPAPPSEAPAPLQSVIMRCLEKNPNDRYADCEAFLGAFLEAIEASKLGDWDESVTIVSSNTHATTQLESFVPEFLQGDQTEYTPTPEDNTNLEIYTPSNDAYPAVGSSSAETLSLQGNSSSNSPGNDAIAEKSTSEPNDLAALYKPTVLDKRLPSGLSDLEKSKSDGSNKWLLLALFTVILVTILALSGIIPLYSF